MSRNILLLASCSFFVGASIFSLSHQDVGFFITCGIALSLFFFLWFLFYIPSQEFSGPAMFCDHCETKLTNKDRESNICHHCGKTAKAKSSTTVEPVQ